MRTSTNSQIATKGITGEEREEKGDTHCTAKRAIIVALTPQGEEEDEGED